MPRTLILSAALASMAVASLVQEAPACRWRSRLTYCDSGCQWGSGPTCCYSTCDPAPPWATIVVRLPADAKVFFNDGPTASTGSRRVFTSPPLTPGREFSYTVRAEANRGGQVVAATMQVAVRAFSTTHLDFGDMTSAIALGEESDPELGAPPKAVRRFPALPRHPLEPPPDTKFDKVEKIERTPRK